MRLRGETVRPLAAPHARTATESTPSKAASPAAAAAAKSCGWCDGESPRPAAGQSPVVPRRRARAWVRCGCCCGVYTGSGCGTPPGPQGIHPPRLRPFRQCSTGDCPTGPRDGGSVMSQHRPAPAIPIPTGSDQDRDPIQTREQVTCIGASAPPGVSPGPPPWSGTQRGDIATMEAVESVASSDDGRANTRRQPET
jgi:hypothetical protein